MVVKIKRWQCGDDDTLITCEGGTCRECREYHCHEEVRNADANEIKSLIDAGFDIEVLDATDDFIARSIVEWRKLIREQEDNNK